MIFSKLSIVDDGLTKRVEKKPKFRLCSDIITDESDSRYSLIEPINGFSANEAAQQFLFDNPRDWFVYVKVALPETKYELTENRKFGRSTSDQHRLQQEADFATQLKTM